MMHRELVIVGAGPAGMAAAVAAARHGVEVALFDDNAATGGQIYRQPPRSFHTNGQTSSDPTVARDNALKQAVAGLDDRIDLILETTVWGVFPKRRLAFSRQNGWNMVEAKQVILANGAYEHVPPFPGWTLPGVMTPGAAQSMVKTMRIRPGKRVLVAGSGPFLLVVARQLIAAGVEVIGVVEASRRRDMMRQVTGLLSDLDLLRQGWKYLRDLRRAGVPIHGGWLVTEAHGAELVEGATIAQCDADGNTFGRERTIPIDTLCVGYGFVPRTELAQAAGCRMHYRERLGGWIPEVNDSFETSVAGIRVVGDGGGVAGAIVAEQEGTLAGIAVAHKLGRIDGMALAKESGPLVKSLARLKRFQAALNEVYRLRPGLTQLAKEDTIVCRCEEVTRSELGTCIDFGGTRLRTLKVMSRIGMGPCQGKMCWPGVARMIAARTGSSVADCGMISVRPPVDTVRMSDLLNESSGAATLQPTDTSS